MTSQLRLNPFTGRWITIVSERAERPTDFAPRDPRIEADPSRPCPFCPEHELETPPALETYSDEGGWLVRVVPNRYPAFTGVEPLTVQNLGPVFSRAPASGIHEVFVFMPEHEGSWADLTDAHAAIVMRALRDRLHDHAQSPHVRYTQVIVNHGRESGASLSHPHGQLLGMPFVPGAILDEEAGFERFDGNCLVCATYEAELAEGTRVVLETDDVVALCPYWSGSPFELLVVPKDHLTRFEGSPDADLAGVGVALRDVLVALRRRLGDISYNVVFHTAPHHHEREYHWHVHVWPKLISVAGFERGTGVMINIVPPEYAATELRGVV